jgi:hypothetical protein
LRLTAAAGALALQVACTAGAPPAGGAAASPPPAAVSAPLVAEPAGFDFGRVLPAHSVQKEFRLRNLGRQPVVIENVATDCGCMVVGEYAKELPAGGSTPLTVLLHTPPQPGLVQRTVVVRTPGGNLPLPIRATVVDASR